MYWDMCIPVEYSPYMIRGTGDRAVTSRVARHPLGYLGSGLRRVAHTCARTCAHMHCTTHEPSNDDTLQQEGTWIAPGTGEVSPRAVCAPLPDVTAGPSSSSCSSGPPPE